MHRVTKYTLLAFELNHNLDIGRNLSIDAVRTKIHDKTLFSWLSNRLDIDLSPYTDEDKAEILEFFESMADNVDESRKFGISGGGVNLLLAYCIEKLQEMGHEK